MVVDPDRMSPSRIGPLDRQGCILEYQEPWHPLEGAYEMAEFVFDATTNREGGKEFRYEVSWELFLDRRILNFLIFANQFLLLELLDLLGARTVRMPPEMPCCCLDSCLGQDAVQHGVSGTARETAGRSRSK